MNYQIGQTAYWSDRRGDIRKGEVVKISPSGQITAKGQHGGEVRFMPNGRAIGAGLVNLLSDQSNGEAGYLATEARHQRRSSLFAARAKAEELERELRHIANHEYAKDDNAKALLAEINKLMEG